MRYLGDDGLTCLVKFPDGERDVPAYVDSGSGLRECLPVITPEAMDGWRFVGVLGRTYRWVAFRERLR